MAINGPARAPLQRHQLSVDQVKRAELVRRFHMCLSHPSDLLLIDALNEGCIIGVQTMLPFRTLMMFHITKTGRILAPRWALFLALQLLRTMLSAVTFFRRKESTFDMILQSLIDYRSILLFRRRACNHRSR